MASTSKTCPCPSPREWHYETETVSLSGFSKSPLPRCLSGDAAGVRLRTVESIGPGVEGLKVGDAVSTAPAFSQNQYGVYGELAIVPAAAVMRHPPSLSWEQVAAVGPEERAASEVLVELRAIDGGTEAEPHDLRVMRGLNPV